MANFGAGEYTYGSTVEGTVVEGYSGPSTAFGANQVPNKVSKSAVPASVNGYDPSDARKAAEGLLGGAKSKESKQEPDMIVNSDVNPGSGKDWRVKISLADESKLFYKDPQLTNDKEKSLLYPLVATNGVIFPYTPNITMTHTAEYSSAAVTHSLYSQPFYVRSDVQDISISGDFTVQTATEGSYLMAVIYFLRASTKMFFGSGANAGNPPPMVFLDGYGSHYFPHVPCVVTSFSHDMPDDVDYISVPTYTSKMETINDPTFGGSSGSVQGITLGDAPNASGPNWYTSDPLTADKIKNAATKISADAPKTKAALEQSGTRLPTRSKITVVLKPVYSRKNLFNNFNLDQFAAGKLLSNPNKGTGGFI